MEKLAEARTNLRRLVFQLTDLGLPITPHYEREGGLASTCCRATPNNEQVMIGHANGIITIDLVETLDDYRESMRVVLGEPYRTMLGHFRHEVGHYYQRFWWRRRGPAARRVPGRSSATNARATPTHRPSLPTRRAGGWQTTYISEYATMHPWEDFAECFAHYLHISDTLQTTASGDVVWHANPARGYPLEDIVPLVDYRTESAERMLWDWGRAATFFNLINRSMGKTDLYPFELNAAVFTKLSFVHRVVVHAATVESAPAVANVE